MLVDNALIISGKGVIDSLKLQMKNEGFGLRSLQETIRFIIQYLGVS